MINDLDMTRMLSVVIPAFNEAGNVDSLVRETLETLPADLLGEVIVVDDFSTDATVQILDAIRQGDPRLRVLQHMRNAGQSAAVQSGVRAARFGLIATMDGDGQNLPADIAALAAAFDPAGPQLVGGVRTKRRDTWSKRAASRFANGLRRAILHDDCPDTGCGIKVFSRDIYLRLPFFQGQHRYLPALFAAYGGTCVFLPVGDRPRLHGQSKYTNWQRGLVGVYDLVGVGWLIRRARHSDVTEATAP